MVTTVTGIYSLSPVAGPISIGCRGKEKEYKLRLAKSSSQPYYLRMAHVIGIDPGNAGAIALIEGEGRTARLVSFWDMPTEPVRVNGKERRRVSPKAVCSILNALVSSAPFDQRPVAVIEHVHGYGRDGSVGAFAFGRSFGIVETAAHGAGLNVHLVTPQLWKARLGLCSSKAMSRRLAKEVFPDSAHHFARVKDDGRAEATLIAWYWLRTQHCCAAVQW